MKSLKIDAEVIQRTQESVLQNCRMCLNQEEVSLSNFCNTMCEICKMECDKLTYVLHFILAPTQPLLLQLNKHNFIIS